MKDRNVKILGTGKYLPKRKVYSDEIDKIIGAPKSWSENKSGVKERYFVEDETASYLAAEAIHVALKSAQLGLSDIDCIISTSGTMQQPIPCNAALIQEQLGLSQSGIPCFDINTTCLSFVVGLDMVSYLIEAGKYDIVVLVSSEISSKGLNWSQNESSVLFGDGATAVIVGKANTDDASKILSSDLVTYSSGAHLSEIRGGGTALDASNYNEHTKDEFLFDMNGTEIFKLSSQLLPEFIDKLLNPINLKMSEIDMVVPHQASKAAMRLIRKKLKVDTNKFMSIIETHGNIIAASIPMALHEAIITNRITRGDKVMLLGTSAGLSIGGIVLVY